MNEELMNFVNWLPEHVELFKGLTTEETVSKINNLSASEEGKETLEQLTKQYKNTEMGIFKEGGKLNYLLCLQKGGAIQDCGCGKKIEKNQPGGEISRRDALNMLRTTGSGNAESRKEYRDAKRDARESGLRGKEMRQAARRATMARGIDRIMPILDDTVAIEEIPIVFKDTFANLEVPTSLGVSIMDKVPVTPNDVIGGSFKEAFAEARRRGLKNFVWDNARAKYDSYHTGLKSEESENAPLGFIQPIVNKIMTGEGDPAATKRSESPSVWYPGRVSR